MGRGDKIKRNAGFLFFDQYKTFFFVLYIFWLHMFWWTYFDSDFRHSQWKFPFKIHSHAFFGPIWELSMYGELLCHILWLLCFQNLSKMAVFGQRQENRFSCFWPSRPSVLLKAVWNIRFDTHKNGSKYTANVYTWSNTGAPSYSRSQQEATPV